jgi:hypothetical protein
MRKRMMAFLMALLMVVTILPANFTIVEANDTNGAIYLKVTGASDWIKEDDIKVTVTDSTGKEVDQKFVQTEVVKVQTDSGNTNPDNTDSGNNNPGNTDTGKDDAAGKDTENTGSESGSDNSNEPAGQADEQQDAKPVEFNSIKIDVTGLVKDSKYSVDISSDGYLFWKKECTAVEASYSPAYTAVAMVKDTYTEFAFTTVFKGWKLDTKPTLAVKGADNNSVIKYASSDQETAAVDETTGEVTIKKAGKVSFTATLSAGDSYKTITQSDVSIAKLDQTLSFTDENAEVYVGDEISTIANSSASDAKGKLTYSVVTGEEYIIQDADFTNNGKWTAKSYNNSADGVKVTIKAAIAEDDRYNSAEKTYTTTIKPYAYDDFRKYCEVVGTSNTASDGNTWYSEVTGIKAKDGYKIKNSDGSFVEEIAIDANNITQGENQFTLVIVQEKKKSDNENVSYINEGTVSGAYNYDSVNPTLSIKKDNKADWVNKDVTITASPSDDGSKLAAVKYTVTDEKDKPLLEETTVNPNADGSYLITLQASKFANKEIKVNVTAYDNAGLRSDTQTKIIKFDTELPEAELSLNSNEGKYYFTDKISVGISATDNFSGIAGIKAVYLTDDVTSASGWDIKNIDWDAENVKNLEADAKSVTIPFTNTTNAGNVYVKVTDKAGNENITSLSDNEKFHFDHTAPTVGIAYSSADENTTNDNYSQLKDGVEYYNHDRYAQITVTDASFNKNATQIKVAVDNKKAVNILDNKAEVQGAAIVKTDNEIWTDNKDGSYTAKLKFTGNHLYKIEASSKDLAGNKTEEATVADSKSKEFYIDEDAPAGKVQFSTDKTNAIGNWWKILLNSFPAISIFKQNQLDIVGSVTDGNSGIWTVSYYVNKLDTDTVLSEQQLNGLSAGNWEKIKINKSDDGYSFCESLDKSYNKYIVYIKIVDNSGNVKYISTEGAIIDNEAPEITEVNIVDSDKNKLEDENADLWKQSKVCLQVKATDNLSGIDRYEYKLEGLKDNGTATGTVKLKDTKLGTLNDDSTVFDLKKSDYYAADTKALKATITVYDRANNSSTVEKIINIDKQAPTVTITRDDENLKLDNSKGWNKDTLTYTVVAKDVTSGIKAENENPVINYYIYLNGKKMKTGKVNVIDKKLDASGAYTEVVGNITISKDKAYDSNNLTIDVDTVDVAGNKSVSSADTKVTAKYDFTAPTAKLKLQQGVDGDKWFTNGATFTVTAQDNTSGIEKVGYTIKKADGTDGTDGTYVAGSADAPVELITGVESDAKEYTNSISIPDMADYDTGNLTITTYTYDFAGNMTECSQTIKFDTTNPTADLTVNAGANQDGWFNSGATFSVKASDATSGVDKVEYFVKASKDSNENLTSGTLTADTLQKSDNGDLTGTITIPKDAYYDSKNLYVETKTYDKAGNKTECSQTIKFDTTHPTAGISFDKEMKNSLSDKGGFEGAKHFYNRDVKLYVTANDATSGIKSIKYYVTAAGDVPTEETWADTTNKNVNSILPEKQAGTNDKLNIPITISDKFANSADNLGAINVYVQVIDTADNETVVSLKDDEKDETFRIDTTKPEINVEYATEKAAYSVVDGAEYYNTERTAKVSVKENSVFFNPKLVNIWVSEDGGKEVDINNSDKLPNGIVKDSDWTLGAGKDAVSTLTVTFTNNHKYTVRVEAQDLAENKADGYKINKSNTFIIDKKNPTGNMKYNYLSQGTDTTWTSFADWKNILNGGKYEISRFSKGKMYVSGSVRDEFSGVKEVSYNVSNKDGVFADVSGVTSWTPMKSTGKDGSYAISLPENDMNYVVYLKIVDYSGNVSYVSTNGAVLDTQAPKINVTLPTDINGIYASNVNVGVSVSDNAATGVVSGIRSVSYKVTSLGQQTQTGDLYTYTATAGSLNDLTKSVSRNFTVDAGLNNSNDVQIEVTAVDNAGNTYKTTNVIKIDITAPTIEVSYDNNSGDTTFGDDTYFKESRTATVKVTERNFDPAKVIPVIEASAGGVPSISGWTTVGGSGNGDDTVNIATIYYGNDADYTFNISAEDIAGNKSGEVNYGNSLAPTKFTVDKTVPVISVAYDNNNAAEAGFYKEQRTATVTIQEHNFETSRVVLTMNATDNGNPASAPTISGWSGSGDTHTATISFASDAVYTWTLAYTDKAGNKATDLENQSFCVDLTKPAITISGINPNSANNTDGNIGFAIECTDTNFGTFTPVLTAVVYENGSFATKEIAGSTSSVGNGERIEYGNLEEDGMYSLRCAAVDKAGNAYDTVNIVDEDGVTSTVNLQDGDNLIDFSVNRNGSTFALNDYSMDVVNDYYVQETAEDIVFYETNADELLNYNIKLNGNALKEGNDYKVTESGGDGSWYRYEYAVNKSLFDDEGEYNLVVESEDKATSMAYSDLKNVSADFVIDKTAPTFTISGIEEDGNYRGTSQNVTLVPTDDGGKLGHVKVTILDKDGKEQKVISDMSGDELTKYLNGNDGKIKFKVPEGVNQQVAILCADCSIGTDGGTNTTDFIYKGITVSSNAFILFFENKPLFYGVLGVVAAAIIVPTGFVIYKKKRKTKKEASEQ